MHAGRKYTFSEIIVWSRRSIFYLLLIGTIPTVLYKVCGLHWLSIPWAPVTLIGTAAAFITGFRNNATYSRMWEARQIYGGILNASRSWGMMARDMLSGDSSVVQENARQLIYRHLAWLTCLRFQLRMPRVWENVKIQKKYIEYKGKYSVQEWESNLNDELRLLISSEECQAVLASANVAAQLIARQSAALRVLNASGHLETLKHIELNRVLEQFYELQGRAERIKNFPYPRQFASISNIFIHLFILMLPFGIIRELDGLSTFAVWLNIPFTLIIGWVFTILEFVGESTENPFEGGANDIPITAISRTIEIDLREMLGEEDVPAARVPQNHILT